MERDAHLQSIFYLTFRNPNMGALPLGSPKGAPAKSETLPFRSLELSLKIPSKRNTPQVPKRTSKETPVSSAFFYTFLVIYLFLKVPAK
jgi:hypothetical protein